MVMRKIKVGLIRCDLHGLYYGMLMFPHDPIAVRDDKIVRGQAAFFYHYMSYNDPRLITVPTVSGFELARVWDKNEQVAARTAALFSKGAKVCRNFEDVSDDVDLVFIADCMGDGSDKLRLAAPGILKRVPTFIDKPLAYEVEDARRLVALARRRRTPIMSLSIMRCLPQAALFRRRFAELGEPEFGTIKGGGALMAGHIHTISLAQNLFGNGVKSVECMGATPLAYVHLDYGKTPHRPKAGVMLQCASGDTYHCSSYASAYSRQGAIHSPAFGDFEFPWGAARNLELTRQMIKTGRSPMPCEDMVECIAVASAARLAQKRGRRVLIKDV